MTKAQIEEIREKFHETFIKPLENEKCEAEWWFNHLIPSLIEDDNIEKFCSNYRHNLRLAICMLTDIKQCKSIRDYYLSVIKIVKRDEGKVAFKIFAIAIRSFGMFFSNTNTNSPQEQLVRIVSLENFEEFYFNIAKIPYRENLHLFMELLQKEIDEKVASNSNKEIILNGNNGISWVAPLREIQQVINKSTIQQVANDVSNHLGLECVLNGNTDLGYPIRLQIIYSSEISIELFQPVSVNTDWENEGLFLSYPNDVKNYGRTHNTKNICHNSTEAIHKEIKIPIKAIKVEVLGLVRAEDTDFTYILEDAYSRLKGRSVIKI